MLPELLEFNEVLDIYIRMSLIYNYNDSKDFPRLLSDKSSRFYIALKDLYAKAVKVSKTNSPPLPTPSGLYLDSMIEYLNELFNALESNVHKRIVDALTDMTRYAGLHEIKTFAEKYPPPAAPAPAAAAGAGGNTSTSSKAEMTPREMYDFLLTLGHTEESLGPINDWIKNFPNSNAPNGKKGGGARTRAKKEGRRKHRLSRRKKYAKRH